MNWWNTNESTRIQGKTRKKKKKKRIKQSVTIDIWAAYCSEVYDRNAYRDPTVPECSPIFHEADEVADIAQKGKSGGHINRTILTHFCRVDSSTISLWTDIFPIKGVSGWFYY